MPYCNKQMRYAKHRNIRDIATTCKSINKYLHFLVSVTKLQNNVKILNILIVNTLINNASNRNKERFSMTIKG